MDLINNKYSIEELDEYISNNEVSYSDWVHIAVYQKLTYAFIEKYKDKLDWWYISRFQKLSENFIEKYVDSVIWGVIIKYQPLSYSFLVKHLYKYSLYITFINNINKEKILKLQEVYKEKYCIDKLEHELNNN